MLSVYTHIGDAMIGKIQVGQTDWARIRKHMNDTLGELSKWIVAGTEVAFIVLDSKSGDLIISELHIFRDSEWVTKVFTDVSPRE